MAAGIKISQLPSLPSASTQNVFPLSFNGTTYQFTAYNMLSNAGNPNGSVAGALYQLLWDINTSVMYICTTAGSSSSAVWTQAFGTPSPIPWTNVTGTTQIISSNNYYIANGSLLITFTLPTTSAIGDVFIISGAGAGGWTIVPPGSQVMNVGNKSSTPVTGSVSSTSQTDSLYMVCTVANTAWNLVVGEQGNLDVI